MCTPLPVHDMFEDLEKHVRYRKNELDGGKNCGRQSGSVGVQHLLTCPGALYVFGCYLAGTPSGLSLETSPDA